MTTSMDSSAWDERYGGAELVWGAGPNVFLEAEVTGLAPGTAVDIACGEGRNAIWLAEQGWQVVGVDFSGVALDKARRLAAERGVEVEWVHADLATWEPPQRFDLVVVMYLHLVPELRHRLLGRLAGSVAPGGTMLVVAHDVENLSGGFGGPQSAEVLYGPDDVAADLRGELEIERAERVLRPVTTPEGGEARAIDCLVRAARRR